MHVFVCRLLHTHTRAHCFYCVFSCVSWESFLFAFHFWNEWVLSHTATLPFGMLRSRKNVIKTECNKRNNKRMLLKKLMFWINNLEDGNHVMYIWTKQFCQRGNQHCWPPLHIGLRWLMTLEKRLDFSFCFILLFWFYSDFMRYTGCEWRLTKCCKHQLTNCQYFIWVYLFENICFTVLFLSDFIIHPMNWNRWTFLQLPQNIPLNTIEFHWIIVLRRIVSTCKWIDVDRSNNLWIVYA